MPDRGTVREQRPVIRNREIIDDRENHRESNCEVRKPAMILHVPIPLMLSAMCPARNAHQTTKANSVVNRLRVAVSLGAEEGCQKYY